MLTKEMKHRLDTVTSLDCREDPALEALSLCLTDDTAKANKTNPFVKFPSSANSHNKRVITSKKSF